MITEIMNFEQHETQNIVYSVVLLVFLLMGLVGRKNLKIQTMLKYSVLWFLIIMVIISLYSYRDHFKDFTSRLSSELNPTKAVKKNNQIVIREADDHHYYLTTTINNKKIIFMIDTGASDIVMSIDDAKKIGIDIAKINFNKRYQTANGIVLGGSTKIDKMIIADFEFNDVNISINQARMGKSLMGVSFLKRFKKYEFADHQLILTL
jgi:aspartyl protease family protein